MKLKRFGFLILPSILLCLGSCLGSNEESFDLDSWRKENTAFLTNAEAETLNGNKVYDKVIPDWDPASFTLMKWHTDRNANAGGILPIANSTLAVKYLLTNVRGDTLDSSYAQADSLFICKPCEMITGFWIATQNMHVGDSVEAVIPYTAGYGITGSGSILPYSTLVFQIKLDSIVAYDSLPWRD